jgi:hypothetical protein
MVKIEIDELKNLKKEILEKEKEILLEKEINILKLKQKNYKKKEYLEQKVQRYKEQGYADKEFEKIINNKRIKIILPNSVFDQQKLLFMGLDIMTEKELDFNNNFELTKKYLIEVCKNMWIDNKQINPESIELPELQAYGYMYWEELLYPLHLRGDILAREIIE